MEVDDADADQADSSPGTPPPPPPGDNPKGKATAKPTVALVRESGKSLLPVSRVQKIMKADKVRGYQGLHPFHELNVHFRSYPSLQRKLHFSYH